VVSLRVCSSLSEKWFLVQFEDEGQVYCALQSNKVQQISLSEDEDDDQEIFEGDYVEALYDAKVMQIGKIISYLVKIS
jgi:hypothetical protein